MTKKKEVILRKFAKDTFDSLPVQEEETIKEERKGIREGTKGLSGARIIEISRIKLDPEQPRKSLNQKRLNELAESIKKHGLLQPISVEYIEHEDCFKIINGERRYKAAKLSDLQELPCIIKNIDRHTRLIHQLIENIQRQDLPPLEEADSIQALINKKRMDNPNYSQREASRELGLPKSYVNEMLSLLKLPRDIKESVRTSDTVPKSLLLLLLRQSDEKNIKEFYRQIKEGKLTVREAKTRIKKSKIKKGRPKYYEYKFESPGREFILKIKFKKSEIEQSEIFNALHQALNSLNK
ncbi:ParB/RepB/Spo0J family partition protein [bacterium]|nr:ParB/RepB/Spo0J family partition protein [bacterium]MBU4603195.1 ParB/RepB/Spo0J family partition protein [bacterium]